MIDLSISDVLTRAADLLDKKGACRGANARLEGGKACGVFDQRAASFSLYGALCAVLGPGLGDDKALQASPAWKLIALRAWALIPQDVQAGSRLEYALHDLNEHTKSPALFFRDLAGDAEIKALGTWR